MRVEVLPGMFYTLTGPCSVCDGTQQFTPTHFNVDNYAPTQGKCDQCGTAYTWSAGDVNIAIIDPQMGVPAASPISTITIMATNEVESQPKISTHDLEIYGVPRMQPVMDYLKEVAEQMGVPLRVFAPPTEETEAVKTHKAMREYEAKMRESRLAYVPLPPEIIQEILNEPQPDHVTVSPDSPV